MDCPPECPVCLEVLSDCCVTLSCEHQFHDKCLARWVRKRADCPICRRGLSCTQRQELMLISNQDQYQMRLRRLSQQQRIGNELCCCIL